MGGMTVVASSDDAPARLATGNVLKRLGETALGAAAIGFAVATIAWVILAIAGSAYARPVAKQAMPTLLTVLAVGQILATVGRERADQADMLLRGLIVRIDGDGIGWTAPAKGSLSWDRVRFVVLAKSRLWVGGPDARSVPDGNRPDWISYLRRLARTREFALDVPLEVLDHSRAELAQAIREASRGRFPNGSSGAVDGRV